jgi:hypothetical protein
MPVNKMNKILNAFVLAYQGMEIAEKFMLKIFFLISCPQDFYTV